MRYFAHPISYSSALFASDFIASAPSLPLSASRAATQCLFSARLRRRCGRLPHAAPSSENFRMCRSQLSSKQCAVVSNFSVLLIAFCLACVCSALASGIFSVDNIAEKPFFTRSNVRWRVFISLFAGRARRCSCVAVNLIY